MNPNPPETNNLTPEAPDALTAGALPGDEITGLPLLQTWRKVYLFVFIVFSVYVVLLTILSKVFA